MNDTDLLFSTLAELGVALRKKQISSLDLTTLTLKRLETLGPRLGALAHLSRPLALVQAAQADRELKSGKPRGPLHGIPFAMEDRFATANDPTEWSSAAFAGQVFDFDAAVTERLREAGAVLMGQLSMIELAGAGGYRSPAASVWGPARNPWNAEHWAGGSSSGPGAAVASGLAGFALGSETNGSLAGPASFCGVSSLRPTFGRVSRYGAMPLSPSLDTIGPLARSAEDCGIILEALAGSDTRDGATSDAGKFRRGKLHDVRGLRIGIVRPNYRRGDTLRRAQPQTETAFEGALGVLTGLGATLSDVTLPAIPIDEAADAIFLTEGSASLESLIRDQMRFAKIKDEAQQGGLLAGLAIPGVDYLRSLRIRTQAQRLMADFLAPWDALVAPGRLQVAPLVTDNLDEYFVGSDGGFEVMGRLCGLPALCVPMGFGPDHLPLGLQLIGAAYDEVTLLSLGIAYQKLTDWHRQRPPAPFGT